MTLKKKLALAGIVLLLGGAAPSARAVDKNPMSVYIGQCIVIVTGAVAVGGTVTSVDDHFVRIDEPINNPVPGSPMLVGLNNLNVVFPQPGDTICNAPAGTRSTALDELLSKMPIPGR
jgi:hypothetical protein